MKQHIVIIMLGAALTGCATREPSFNNVIVMVPDGCGSTHMTLSRWYNGGGPLNIDRMNVSAVRTFSAESVITDSAPAATAFATGHKSNAKFISMLPDRTSIPGLKPVLKEDQLKPVATVLEAAKRKGKATGIVATSQVQHATPAAFTAHTERRDDYTGIAKQQVYQDLTLALGGGLSYLLPESKGGVRKDGLDLTQVLREKGYTVVTNKAGLAGVTSGKCWGLFAPIDMEFEFDRRHFCPEQQPKLSEMTEKAIDILSKDKDGFFLFVEGSKVDWASHANDPIGVISEYTAFDEAVGKALEFAEKDGRTLVLVFTDHSNGGMSIGRDEIKYYDLPFTALINPLKKALLTGAGVEKILKDDRSEENIRTVVGKYYGIDNLTKEEIKNIAGTKKGKLSTTLGHMISAGEDRSYIGWTTTGHTGEDTFMFNHGLTEPLRIISNTDIAGISAKALGVDLATADQDLYVDISRETVFSNAEIKVDVNAGIVRLKGKIATAELYIDTNRMVIEIAGRKTTHELGGLIIHSPNGKTYIPREAVRIWTQELIPIISR